MENQIVVSESNNLMLMPGASLSVIKQVYQAKKEFIESILKKNVDFGTIPGSEKPALLKPGAEKMSSFFNLAPSFEDIEKVEDWTGEQHGNEPFFYYRVRCHMFNGERRIASADGSCNSWEKKYRYRQATRVCPICKQTTIIKGKKEYGGGWLCFKNKGGCGAKFIDSDDRIISQEVGQIVNPDVAEQVNTILKMAQKRALVAVTLIATGTSEYFTQDIEDFIDGSFVPEPVNGKVTDDHEPIQPDSAPSTNHVQPTNGKSQRPLSPETLAQMITNKARTYGNIPVSDKQVALAASMMELCFAGQEHTDKIRHSIIKYLTGYSSLKDCSGAEVKAILDWLKPVKDSGGAYIPDPMAQQEIHAVWTAALKDAGQEELLMATPTA